MAIALGIDTGGTYTDAVLVEYGTDRVLASTKALTTKQDLTLGIRQAVQRILALADGLAPTDVNLVSVSTTLATNAIVEGNGAPICVLLLGYEGRLERSTNLARELGTSRYALIPGGHRANGEEWEPLNLAAVERAISEHAASVAGFAVSGYFGTRNPEHELAVRDLIRRETRLPVTCGHELTHRLDALRRATTVALNARLIPLICDLIDSVGQIMQEEGIRAPLMVVKGDGSLMSAGLARERPIETILSGPAASVVGAQHLAGGKDVVVVDMGGTTTDIAVIDGQGPKLSARGAQVGRWRTMVEAIDVHTVGLGGDSRVWLDEAEELCIGPRRVVPLSLLAQEHPQVLETLSGQLDALRDGERASGEFLLTQRRSLGKTPLSSEGSTSFPFQAQLAARLELGPCSLDEVHRLIRYPQLYGRHLAQMESQGEIVRSAFTPSDAAHALGIYRTWDERAARLGAEILAHRLGWEAEALCRHILRQTSIRIATQIVTKLLHDDGLNGQQGDSLDSALIARAMLSPERPSLACRLALRPRLVAIGAPVQTYFPLVGELLSGELTIPEHAEVANAIGAVVGSVVCRIHVLIVPQQEQGYRVHLPNQVKKMLSLAQAIAYGQSQARELAIEGALKAGAEDLRVQVARHDRTAPVGDGWGQRIHVQTDLEVTAIGRPRLAI